MDKVINLVFTFFFFSAIGWTVESTYRSLGERRIINSGFLHGHVCPIYGTGMLVFEVLVVPWSMPFQSRWWLAVLAGTIAADIVEYVTSVLMEKLFNARWWDYSDNFLNINGRICFKHTCYWAIAAFLAVYVISPLYHSVLGFIPVKWQLIIVIAILCVFSVDLFLTVRAAINVQKIMKKLDSFRQLLYLAGEAISTGAEEARDFAEDKYEELRKTVAENGQKFDEWRDEVSARYDEFKANVAGIRSGEKTDRNSRETRRLIIESERLRTKVAENMKQIEKRLSEIRDLFPGSDDGKKE